MEGMVGTDVNEVVRERGAIPGGAAGDGARSYPADAKGATVEDGRDLSKDATWSMDRRCVGGCMRVAAML
jgi:hypothetical protein